MNVPMNDARPDLPGIDEPSLVLVINQAYVAGSSPLEVFEATSGHWRVGPGTRAETSLVFGVAEGTVRGVFRPSRWFPSPIAGQEGRWGFEGKEAAEFAHLVGSSIDRLPVKRGASNPVRRYMNGIPAIGEEGSALEALWELEPGDYLGRQERQDIYGGGTMGGIQPAVDSPNVFVYSDPARGSKYGYQFDGWNADSSVFFYTGEGRIGDQALRKGNRAILDHAIKGRALRLFIAEGYEPGTRTARQLYIGQFEIDPDLPFEVEVSSDDNGEARTVYVFRLLPIGPSFMSDAQRSAHPIADLNKVQVLPVTQETLETTFKEIEIELVGSAESAHEVTARILVRRRREAVLVLSLRDVLVALGHQVHRQQIQPAGQAHPIYTDLFDATDNVLYEAKSDSSRESVRMAIGQLLDYRRFLPEETQLAVLVPTKPARDLCELLRSVDVDIRWPEADGSYRF